MIHYNGKICVCVYNLEVNYIRGYKIIMINMMA